MNIIISNANNEPIYEQIYQQIKASIISDKLKEGEMLPSIRNLAKDLKISVITTKRAYDELQNDGYIYSSQGRGFFVAAKNTEILKETYLKEIEANIKNILKIAPICDLKVKDIIEMIKIVSQED